MIGATLANRYQITGELGRGGMGVVYRARDPLLGRDIAVKLIPPLLLTAQAEERLRREAQLVAQMDHPAIVPLFDIGEHEGSLFLLMPVVEGRNLRTFMGEKPRSLGLVLDIVGQVADALAYSHNLGVVHRDVKPENVMVSGDESAPRTRVTDFGLARTSSYAYFTRSGALVGTMSYFSPEQVLGQHIEGRSDVYSLGVMLFESICGEVPFTGETQSVLYRIAHEHVRSPRSLGATIGEELDQIVLRALAKDPSRRFDAAEFADSVRRCRLRLDEDERNAAVALSTTSIFQRPALAPLIGRERELTELQRRLNVAMDGECHFALIGGDPGIGKTRLVEEIETLAKARRVRVLHGRFHEQEQSIRYQGFVEAIQEYFGLRSAGRLSGELADFSDLAADLISVFPVLVDIAELRTQSDSGAPSSVRGDDRTQIYELLARTFIRIAGGNPLVLVFENLHAAEVSLDGLQYLVRRASATPLFILGTWRPTEVTRRHGLMRLIDSFSGDPRFTSITVGPLSSGEHRRLVESLIGSAAIDHDLLNRIYEATEANPLFTRELVRSFIDSGGIVRRATGEWSLSGDIAISSAPLPATIQQIVAKRMERLPEELGELLAVCSILGRSFDVADLETLVPDIGDLDGSIDKLIAEGLLEEDRESRADRVSFSSGIVRDVLYSTITRRRKKSLHRRFAEQLERRNEGRIERVRRQLVHHYAEGDVGEKAIEHGLAAARHAFDAFRPEDVQQLLAPVMEFTEEEPASGDRASRAEAHLLLARSLQMTGNAEPAAREAAAAHRLYDAMGKTESALDAVLLAGEAAWQARKVDEAQRWIDRGLESARREHRIDVLRRLLSLAATIMNLRCQYGAAAELLDELERLDQPAMVNAAPRRPGGRIVVASSTDVHAMEPAQITTVEEGEIFPLACETLVRTDGRGHLLPLLAKGWKSEGEGSRFRFTLRRDAIFHDGGMMTADDVRRSFERAVRFREGELAPGVSAILGVSEYRAQRAEAIEGITVIADDELEITLRDPLPIYPALLTDPATAVVHETAGGIAGTGPFQLKSRAPGRIIFSRRGDGLGVMPLLDEVEFRTIPSASEIAEKLRSGEIDVARDLTPNDVDTLLRDRRVRRTFVEAPKPTTWFALFNTMSEVGKSAALRQALTRLVRTHDLVWRSIGRLGHPAVSLIPPGFLGHDPGRRRAPLTTLEASEMLKASGLPQPIRLRALVHPLLRERYRKLLDALLTVWGDAGIELTAEAVTIDDFVGRLDDNRDVDVLLMRWNADYEDPDTFTHSLFHSSAGLLHGWFWSPETDSLCERARVDTDPAARELLYRKFDAALIDSGVVLPLFHEIDYRLAGPAVSHLNLMSTAPYVDYMEIARVEPEGAPATMPAGGTLHVAIAEGVADLDPVNAATAEVGEVTATIFDTLTRAREGARIAPWLASGIAMEAGGTRARIAIRENARFHDGRHLTARDVRYSWERLLRSRNQHHWAFASIRGARDFIEGRTDSVSGIQLVSTHELVVHLETPCSFFPALLADVQAAIVVEGTTAVTGGWKEGCIGSGPFRVARFEPRRRIELERNPFYWRDGLPRCDALVFHLGINADQAREELIDGNLSIASGLFPADVEKLRQMPELAAGFRAIPRLSTYYAAFNSQRGPLRNMELRRRIVRALDVPALVRRGMGRLAIPANGIIPPGLLGHGPSNEFGRASRQLETRVDVGLNVLMHPLLLGEFSSFGELMLEALALAGIRVEVLARTSAEFRDPDLRARADMLISRWVADYPDPDTFASGIFSSHAQNAWPYCGTPELDELIARGRSEVDPSIRHGIYREIEAIIAANAVVLPLFHEQVYRFARPSIEGMTLNVSFPEVNYESIWMGR